MGFGGINLKLPFQGIPYGSLLVIVISLLISLLVWYWLKRKNLFRKIYKIIKKRRKTMKIGLVKANFPGERRVPLLPKDIKDFKNEILVEEGFGKFLDIDDQEYIDKGCHILSRAEIFAESEAIFSLKLIQPTDYSHLREGQMIIGWTHPLVQDNRS